MEEIQNIGLNSSRFNALNSMNYAINQTYTFSNNNLFYASINPTYFDYYNKIIRTNLEWFDGYVSGFHNLQNGIMSTRIATALVNGIINNVFSTKLAYDRAETEDYTSVDFFSKWSKEHRFLDTIKTLSKFSGASGTAVLKLNVSANKEIWCQALRQDQFVYSTDVKGNIDEIKIYIKPYEDLNTNHDNYFVVERRFFDKEIVDTNVELLDGSKKAFENIVHYHTPYVEYQVYHYRGQILQNTMAGINMQTLEWYDIPSKVREKLREDFGTLRFGVPYKLPFKDSLGCFPLYINGRDPTISTGCFGYGFLTDVRPEIIEYELIQAYQLRDMYNGVGQMAIPKAMSMNDLDNSPYNVNKGNYELYPGDPDKQKPIVNQFDLRAEEWIKKTNNCLQKMATKLGMSPKVIASYLNTAWSNSFGKTATEVESDDSNNQIFLEDKRENLLFLINEVIPHILKFYGFSSNVNARFLKTNSNPTSQDLKDIDFKYQNGYIDLREALREMNPTITEQELDVLEEKALARQEEIKARQEIKINELGDYEE